MLVVKSIAKLVCYTKSITNFFIDIPMRMSINPVVYSATIIF